MQTETLYGLALEYADLKGDETVWDLYCGIGTISLFLAQKAKQVYGVEIIPQAIEDARKNAQINGIENAKFYVGKAEEVLPGYYADYAKAHPGEQAHADVQKAKQVYGVEIIPQAIEDARKNAQINGIENAKFYVGKAEEVLPGYYADYAKAHPGEQAHADVIVVDPPRKGCEKQVYGVEIIPQAIEDARKNAQINGIENAKFYVGKAEEVLPGYYADYAKAHPGEQAHADVIVVDPPRKGCEESLLETMVQMQPERIVYVSCDSATLARDLKYLCGNGYELVKVRAVDQFSQTVHVESIVLLSRK